MTLPIRIRFFIRSLYASIASAGQFPLCMPVRLMQRDLLFFASHLASLVGQARLYVLLDIARSRSADPARPKHGA